MPHRLIDILPYYYKNLLPRFFRNPIPEESLATCDDCAMVADSGGAGLKKNFYYKPGLRCCTYTPPLPNYAVGALLRDKSEAHKAGRKVIARFFHSPIRAWPQGILPTPGYLQRYAKMSDKGFGKLRSLLCPYYEMELDRCSIWLYRGPVCITFFCRHVAGTFGAVFWKALLRYLQALEDALNAYILKRLGWPSAQVSKLPLHFSPNDKNLNYGNRRRAWAHYVGKVEDFYGSAYMILKSLDRTNAEKILSRLNKRHLKKVETAYLNMRQCKHPKRLKINPGLEVQRLGPKSYAVISEEGAFEVSPSMLATIKLFNGKRSQKEILREAGLKWGLKLESNNISDLYRYGLVVDA